MENASENTILEIFKIDKLGKSSWEARLIFVIAVVFRTLIYFFPLGDTDFTVFNNWASAFLNDPGSFANITVADIPLTHGNIIFLVEATAGIMLAVICGFVYTGIYIRNYRLMSVTDGAGEEPSLTEDEASLRKEPEKVMLPNGGFFAKRDKRELLPITAGKLAVRLLLLSLLVVALLFPLAFTLVFFIVIIVIAVPCIVMYPACYLSGDSGLFSAFRDMILKTRGYYMTNVKNLFVILVADWILQFIPMIMSDISYIMSDITNAFIFVFILLALSRYVGIIYCRIAEHPYVPPVIHINNDFPEDYRN